MRSEDEELTWPPLPRKVGGLSGPIRVRRPPRVERTSNGDVIMGLWKTQEREVLVKGTLRREVAWRILLHELAHAALDDAGVSMSNKQEESVVDTVASGMLHVVRYLVNVHHNERKEAP